jgi:hypothetical protein
MPAARPTRKRSKRIQIYLTPSVEKDRLILDVWKAAEENDRPQDLFRQIVYEGLRVLAERGDLPPKVQEGAKVDERVGVRKAVAAGTTLIREIPVPMHYPAPPAYWQGQPPHSPHAAHPGHAPFQPMQQEPQYAPAPAAATVQPHVAPPVPIRIEAPMESDLPEFLMTEPEPAFVAAPRPVQSPKSARPAVSKEDCFLGLMGIGD